MKFLMIALTVLFSLQTCNQETKENQANNLVVTYDYYSRGSANTYIVDNKNVRVLTGTMEKKEKKIATPPPEWNKIMKLVQEVNVQNMSDLEAPSEGRNSDQGAHAEITINKGGKIYKSQTFDHGNPPAELNSLAEAIISLAQTVEKE